MGVIEYYCKDYGHVMTVETNFKTINHIIMNMIQQKDLPINIQNNLRNSQNPTNYSVLKMKGDLVVEGKVYFSGVYLSTFIDKEKGLIGVTSIEPQTEKRFLVLFNIGRKSDLAKLEYGRIYDFSCKVMQIESTVLGELIDCLSLDFQ
jgi:hypothetical protein